jgi:peptidyl-Lys metalloendopeptidase
MSAAAPHDDGRDVDRTKAALVYLSENPMQWNQISKAGLSAVAMVCMVSAQAASNGVVVSIAPVKNTLAQDDDVIVNVTITNTSSSPQYILKWYTPFGGIEESLFTVTRDGARVHYLGAHYKRPAPTAKDYYLLKPGASHTARVELSALYDMSVTGDYTVTYNTASLQLFASALQSASRATETNTEATALAASGSKGVESLTSGTASLWIDGRQPRGTVVEEPLSLSKLQENAVAAASVSYTNCSASRQTTIASAISAARTMATNANSYMNTGVIGTRYTKWFGANNASRVATVKTHFANITNAFNNAAITVDCGCTQSYYAYVYPTQPYKIYVCNAFWSAPLTGTDSKGGTLVHEMSHFNVVAGTDDWVYGQTGAANLAKSNPAQAIDNADSHEYFSENTPALQ